jgi:hypothetical protein
MKLIAIGHWSSTTYGTKADGELFTIDNEESAKQMIARGYAREYEIKPHPVSPKKNLQANESTSSQAEQAVQTPKKSQKPKTKAK